MNYPDSSTVNPTAKKISFSSATLVLIVGLALALAGTTALANLPLTDGLIIIRYKSGGITFSAPTSADGAYQFKGLAAGEYDLSVGGQRVQTITVGEKGNIKGVLSRQPGGTTSITFNGQVVVVPDLPGAAISTASSNIKRPSKVGAASEGIRPILDVDGNSSTDAIVAAPKGGDGIKQRAVQGKNDTEPQKQGSIIPRIKDEVKQVLQKGEEPLRDELPDAPVGTTRSNLLVVIAKAGEKPQPDDLPGKAAPKKSSHESTPPPRREVEWQPYYSGTAPPPPPGGGGADNWPGARSYPTAPPPPPKGGDGKLPGLAIQGDPVPGTSVGLDHDPGGARVSTTKTDNQGAFHFDKLPAGKYKLKVHGLPDQSLTVGGDGIAGGKLMKGSAGSTSIFIFDRWGNSVASSRKDDPNKAMGSEPTTRGTAQTPVSFGSGNADFGGTGPGMMGGGMTPPGAAMGGPGPSPMGSPGGAMRP